MYWSPKLDSRVRVLDGVPKFMIPILDTIWTRRKKISDARLAICNTCTEYNQETTKCYKCGCFMSYKAMLPYVECPLKKWDAINTDEHKES